MTLKVGTPEEITDMFRFLEKSTKDLIKSVIEVVYFMRGSIQYDDMMWRTPYERELMAEFIQERFKTESKHEFPVY